MGLKTNNYMVKQGTILPEAYAVIRNLRVNNGHGAAEFSVQTTRDNALNLPPYETVKVNFEVDRNESPYITAYKAAKGQKTVQRWNEETGQMENVIVDMPFYGWEDDITAE